MSDIIPPKSGSGTAPPKYTPPDPSRLMVDAAELARLRAIEAAAEEWGNAKSGSLAAVEASRALATVLLLCSSESDNPPAPLPTDEQISRLLRENEAMRERMQQIMTETTEILDKSKEVGHASNRIFAHASPHYLKMALAAK